MTISRTIKGPSGARKEISYMQVGLNTRIEHDLRVRLDAQAEKEKRPIAQVVAEALERYLDEKEKEE
jgi:predicted DNA-binding protein